MLKIVNIVWRGASLNVSFAGLELENPIMPAPGPTVNDGQCMVDLVKAGCGAIVAKTISVEPAKVPKPCMIKTNKTKSMLNHELHSDYTAEKWMEEYYPMIAENFPDIPFFCSAGYGIDDISILAPKMKAAGAKVFELSIHHFGELTEEELAQGLTKQELILQEMEGSVKICKSLGLPVFPKYSPFVVPVGEFARRAVEAGADGIVACNSVGPCMQIDINTRQPVTGGFSGTGWLSGEMIKPISLQAVFDIYTATNGELPIIGVGGISKGEDVIEYLMAGASAVGICTAGIYEGPKCYSRIIKETEEWMDKNGVKTIDEIKGCAVNSVMERGLFTENFDQITPQVDESKCVQCGKCFKACNIYKAISWKKGECPSFDSKKCYGCGLCTSVCPTPGALNPLPYWK